MRYVPNQIGIKEKVDLENAKNDVKQVDEITGNALVDLGDLAAGNMEAAVELADMAAGNMDAIAELGAMIATLDARMTALEVKAASSLN
ncbi:MAG: hypothetical protein RSC06_16165 [Clostridia bacterium]